MNTAFAIASHNRVQRTAVGVDVSLLTVKEIAERLNVSERKASRLLSEWRESGGTTGIPGGVRIGRTWRVDTVIFEGWLNSQTMPVTPRTSRRRLHLVWKQP